MRKRNVLVFIFMSFAVFFNHLLCSISAQTIGDDQIIENVVYGHAGDIQLKCDIVKPMDGEGPFPALLFFHGGGWQAGDKSHGHHWIKQFAEHGYVGVTVGYRFAPEFSWPAQIYDAKAAVRYLRQHASELNIDPNRIGVMGESAGAYLAMMVGLTNPGDNLEGKSGAEGFSSLVQAVVSYFGVTDFTLARPVLSPEVMKGVMAYYGKPLTQVLAEFMGTAEPDQNLLRKMSPVTYVDRDDPPILIFQGDADPFVTVAQANRLNDRLEENEVDHQLYIVEGGGHGWTGQLKLETDDQMFKFLDKKLK
ncbi:MAG: alpha/beta hydrolase [Saprospiraceae bacterium]|nr:alpha/beta hydrolase [Saprospiraceae bacterium]